MTKSLTLSYEPSDTIDNNRKSPEHYLNNQPVPTFTQKKPGKNLPVREYDHNYNKYKSRTKNNQEIERITRHAIRHGVTYNISYNNEEDRKEIDTIIKKVELEFGIEHKPSQGLWQQFTSTVSSVIQGTKNLLFNQTKTEEKKETAPELKNIKNEKVQEKQEKTLGRTEYKEETVRVDNNDTMTIDCSDWIPGEHVHLPSNIKELDIKGNITSSNNSLLPTYVYLTGPEETINSNGKQCSERQYQLITQGTKNVTFNIGDDTLEKYGRELLLESRGVENLEINAKAPFSSISSYYTNQSFSTKVNIGDIATKVDGTLDGDLSCEGYTTPNDAPSGDITVTRSAKNPGTTRVTLLQNFNEIDIRYTNEVPQNSYSSVISISKGNIGNTVGNIKSINLDITPNGEKVGGYFQNQSNLAITNHISDNSPVSTMEFYVDLESMPECTVANPFEPNPYNEGKSQFPLRQNTTIKYVDENGVPQFTNSIKQSMLHTKIHAFGSSSTLSDFYNTPTLSTSINNTVVHPNTNHTVTVWDASGHPSPNITTEWQVSSGGVQIVPSERFSNVFDIVIPPYAEKKIYDATGISTMDTGYCKNLTKVDHLKFTVEDEKSGDYWKYLVGGSVGLTALGLGFVGKYCYDKNKDKKKGREGYNEIGDNELHNVVGMGKEKTGVSRN